jgi:hypothetical protein
MKVTIGRVVIYNTTTEERFKMQQTGCNIQKQLPAIVVGVFGETPGNIANLKVMLDGPSIDIWATSIKQGDEEGQWNWPQIQK